MTTVYRVIHDDVSGGLTVGSADARETEKSWVFERRCNVSAYNKVVSKDSLTVFPTELEAIKDYYRRMENRYQFAFDEYVKAKQRRDDAAELLWQHEWKAAQANAGRE